MVNLWNVLSESTAKCVLQPLANLCNMWAQIVLSRQKRKRKWKKSTSAVRVFGFLLFTLFLDGVQHRLLVRICTFGRFRPIISLSFEVINASIDTYDVIGKMHSTISKASCYFHKAHSIPRKTDNLALFHPVLLFASSHVFPLYNRQFGLNNAPNFIRTIQDCRGNNW